METLAGVHSAFCISIFIPTHRAGEEVLQQQDAILLKNHWKDVVGKLQQQGLKEREIEHLLEPVKTLIDNRTFWKHQSDGLALFLADGFWRQYTLPVKFEAFNHVANSFYLKPLMPMFSGDGRFFLLALELEDPHLYEGTRHSITEVQVEDLTPFDLEEVVGYDFKEKNLQAVSQQRGAKTPVYHGHGEGKDDRKDELMHYFRAIDKGLMTMLHDETPPMVVASVDYLFPMYQEANTYQHLFPKHLSVHPSSMDLMLLHEKTWDILKSHFDRPRRDSLAQYAQFRDTDRTSADIRQIVPAALAGKVDTLFLQNRTDIWGLYNPANGEVEVHTEYQAPNVSLMNLVAVQVFLNGGNVYLLEPQDMPDDTSKINALYRY